MDEVELISRLLNLPFEVRLYYESKSKADLDRGRTIRQCFLHFGDQDQDCQGVSYHTSLVIE